MRMILFMGLFFLALAAIQLVTGRAPTEISWLRLPGSIARKDWPWRFWFIFGMNLAIGGFCVAAVLSTR
jgi:hypothetical protein